MAKGRSKGGYLGGGTLIGPRSPLLSRKSTPVTGVLPIDDHSDECLARMIEVWQSRDKRTNRDSLPMPATASKPEKPKTKKQIFAEAERKLREELDLVVRKKDD